MILFGNTAALVRPFGVSDADVVLCRIARMLAVLAAAAVTIAANPSLAQSTCNISSGASQALGANSFACGPNAVVIGALGNPADPVRGTALGDTAQVIGNDGTAVGQFAYADTSSTSLGSGSEAIGTQSVALGTGDDNNINDVTNSYGARASNGTAVGFSAIANTNATAIGHGAQATGSSSVALGIGAAAVNTNSAAIGNGASASGLNSVAIGANSVASTANVVSVGAVGSERRLTHVAAGVNATDAVNVGQLQSTVAGIQSQYAGLQNQVIDNQREARRGIVAAVEVAPVLMPSAAGKITVAFNTGHYRGETGVGIGVSHRLNFAIPTVVYGSYANGGGNEHIGRLVWRSNSE